MADLSFTEKSRRKQSAALRAWATLALGERKADQAGHGLTVV
jgi:hypothetical protein